MPRDRERNKRPVRIDEVRTMAGPAQIHGINEVGAWPVDPSDDPP